MASSRGYLGNPELVAIWLLALKSKSGFQRTLLCYISWNSQEVL